MKVEIEVETGNAAFLEEAMENSEHIWKQIKRQLMSTAYQVEGNTKLFDINGNTVGELKVNDVA